MSKQDRYDYGYGKNWTDLFVYYREGYATSVTDYHEHDFYEVNLILSGNVSILMGERAQHSEGCRVVLTRPGTPHYIACKPDRLYKRLYLLFSEDFVADRIPEWRQLARVFGENGKVLTLDDAQAEELRCLIEQIDRENAPLRQRLLIYCLLSHFCELAESDHDSHRDRIPSYVWEALSYIETHYAQKILADSLACHLHIGRTALMTSFKRHIGKTLGEYLTDCRLRHAAIGLEEGAKLDAVALSCGFSDGSGLCRSFKRRYGVSPAKYIKDRASLTP